MTSRLFRIACVYTALGVLCTLLIAYARCGLAGWPPLASVIRTNAVVVPTYGVGALSDEHRAWSWNYYSLFGSFMCASAVVDEAERNATQTRLAPDLTARIAGRSYMTPGSYRIGAPPRWTVAMEEPLPPEVLRFHDGGWPTVVDIGFGWPMPCVALRRELFQEVPLSKEAEALWRKYPMPVGTAALPTGPMYRKLNDLRYGAYIPTWLSRNDVLIHDGYWPTRVLWRGMIVNTLTWTLLLASPRMTWSGIRTLRWRSRLRRRCCVRCGYSRAGIAPGAICPECGYASASNNRPTPPAAGI